MARGANQKLKMLYLLQILMEKTDEDHPMNMTEILAALEQYGVSAERKSIYTDIENLRQFGIDIIGEQREHCYSYYVASRPFELAELKLLVDSVESAKFITAKKSEQLISKIAGLASQNQASALRRQVYVSGRVKTMNESIYYNVDAIHEAIASNRQIRFQYFQWNVKKEMELRHGGEYYQVSPWALCRMDENCYMVAYSAKDGIIKHFRVDKMLHISQSEDSRMGREIFEKTDIAAYENLMFSMYAGDEETVRIRCENSLAGAIIDRFGKDVSLILVDEDHFDVNVRVDVSRQFLHWVMALGDGARIVGPKKVVDAARDEAERLARQYGVIS